MRLIRRGTSSTALDAIAQAYVGAPRHPVGAGSRPRRHFSHSVRVGQGPSSFTRLSEALWRWDLHREAGLAVGSTGPVSLGGTVVPVAWFGPVGIVLPCRVVEVVDEPRVRGFVYGTLRDHPEDGTERFTIALADDDEVSFGIEAWSRAAGLLPRLGRPVAEVLQNRATRAYLAAAQRLAEPSR